MRVPVIVFLLAIFASVAAAEISLQAPASVPAGSPFKVTWSGAGDPKDFITVVPTGKKEGGYDNYQYAKMNTVDFIAPDDPGDYEVRYLSKDHPYPTIARVGLVVTAVTATITVQSSVDAGAEFAIEWTGPDHPKDFISIVKADAEERKYGPYIYTRKGNPTKLRAPDEPGEYEVRYHSGQRYYTLGRAPISITSTAASLEAAATAAAGGSISVTWSGPDNDRDWISISRADAAPGKYETYTYTSKGSPLSIVVPDEPGSYEIRYHTGQTYTVLGSRPLEITPVGATLMVPAEVVGGDPFTVTWTGPDNRQDYLGLAPAGGDEMTRNTTWAYTWKGNPAKMTAPLEPGDYEVRYQMGRSRTILARASVRVTPPATEPGMLRVVGAAGGTGAIGLSEGGAVELILDASGSMLKKQDGQRRIDIAKEVIAGLIGKTIPAGTPFALRVFGHKEKGSCRTDLEIPLQPLDVAGAAMTIGAIEAMNLSKTPIAKSLEMVAQDLGAVKGERVVVLITDGEETCDGEPHAAIQSLKDAGMDVRINIVGFAIDDANLKETFRYWASLGGGAYHDAASASDLDESLNRALTTPFDVVNEAGEIVASGLVGEGTIGLPAGSYTIRTRTIPPAEASAVVAGGEETTVTIGVK